MNINGIYIDDSQLIEILKKSFNESKQRDKVYRIKLDNKFITTYSGKTVWPTLSAAKNALRNHINCSLLVYQYIENKIPINVFNKRNTISLIIKELMKNKAIEFVELEEY